MSRKLQEHGWKPRWFQKEGENGSFRYGGGYWEAREQGNWDGCPNIFERGVPEQAVHFNLVGFIVFQPFFKGFSPSLTMFFLGALERELKREIYCCHHPKLATFGLTNYVLLQG
ncbi:hypothetical protein NC652_008899 [Populus alba x Populus x berolinensis]|nr:hypothetical protein NC652_008899 [Populus alba x Populus x berolinensis]